MCCRLKSWRARSSHQPIRWGDDVYKDAGISWAFNRPQAWAKKRKLKILIRVKAITAVGGRKGEERSPAGGKDARSTEGKPIRSVVPFHHLWVSESVDIFSTGTKFLSRLNLTCFGCKYLSQIRRWSRKTVDSRSDKVAKEVQLFFCMYSPTVRHRTGWAVSCRASLVCSLLGERVSPR